MLKIGVFSVFLFFIIDLIGFIIKHSDNKYNSGVLFGIIENLKVKQMFFILLDLIFCFLWNTGIWLTLYYLTPCHFIISESLSEYFYYIIDLFRGNDYQLIKVIIYGIVYVFNFILFLVFDEIIILKFFRLDTNTKLMIRHRETYDSNPLYNYKSSDDSISFVNDDNKLQSFSVVNGALIELK